MYTIRKRFKFEMAHQLFDSYSECCKDTIHGHSYILDIFLSSEKLDETGMVIDFGKLKYLLKDEIEKFDHALVLPSRFSKEYIDILSKNNKKIIIVDYNPTAENMARDFFYKAKAILPDCIELRKVRLHETKTGWAEFGEKEEN